MDSREARSADCGQVGSSGLPPRAHDIEGLEGQYHNLANAFLALTLLHVERLGFGAL